MGYAGKCGSLDMSVNCGQRILKNKEICRNYWQKCGMYVMLYSSGMIS